MKVCNTEAMKIIKDLEEEKRLVIYDEDKLSVISYTQGEGKPIGAYDYRKTRQQISDIDGKIRAIRFALAKANCTVVVEEFGVTIAEALVMLAQWRKEYEQLDTLTDNVQCEREVLESGVIEYRETLYDVKTVQQDQKTLNHQIGRLQMAIDRANLTNLIEIPIGD